MAKVAKPKRREVSIHSRAARRQASPQPEGAKAKQTEQNEHWLYSAQNAGVSKKQKVKKLTHAQRVRQSKALERGEKNLDVLEKKVANSKQKGRKVQARRQDWDELNVKVDNQESVVHKQSVGKELPDGAMAGLESSFVQAQPMVDAETVQTNADHLQNDEAVSEQQSDKPLALEEDIIT